MSDPTPTPNKVEFGLSKVYYAVLTEGASNSWGTPKALKGAVSLALSKEGATSKFHADNVTYYQSVSNNGYTGSLTLALITNDFLKDIFGMEEDATSKVIFEKANVQPKPFALMFEINGDQTPTRYVIHRCIAERPNINSETVGDSIEPNTAEMSISCLPLVTGSNEQQGIVYGKTQETTPSATYDAWFSAVNVPTPPTP